MRRFYLIFFLSGIPALIYQVVWQRALFTILGVNIESVALIVTAFMLGLGLGSLLGGAVSKRAAVPTLLAFASCELGIGTFGVFSLSLFHQFGRLTLGTSGLVTFLVAFTLVLIPTLLMGATLPLLVSHLVRNLHNVGRSVGLLYFANTLGSGVASFLCATWLLGSLGMRGAVAVAVIMNGLVGAGALFAYFMDRRVQRFGEPGRPVSSETHDSAEAAGQLQIAWPVALLLVAVCGYISLSYEIVWVRVFGFLTGGVAATFPLLLGAFLVGLAFGSLISTRFCRDASGSSAPDQLRSLAGFLFFANAIGFLVIPATAWAAGHSWLLRYLVPLVAVALAAAMLGATLPIISHSSLRPNARAGAGLSYLYVANIIGSAAGSFLTGFLLMDHWPLRTIAVYLALLGLMLSALLLQSSTGWRGSRAEGLLPVVGTALGVLVLSGPLFRQTYERLQYKEQWKGQMYSELVETKSGVVSVDREGVIYGDGVYDGAFNVDLVRDVNHIDRAYALSLLHPGPRDVLMIGLSSGSWGQVIANHPQLEHFTIVEINPGYLRLIPHHEAVASLLDNPRVEMVIDDGRRWMNRHRDRKFDAIVMNTSFHWRGLVTNLLSLEFLDLARSHLKPGGILYYNTTGSPEAQRTAASAFPYAVRVYNFIAVSDQPIDMNPMRWGNVLRAYRIDGHPILDTAQATSARTLDGLLLKARWPLPPGGEQSSESGWLEGRESLLARTVGARVITDDNMATEWTAEAGSLGPLIVQAVTR